MAASQAELFQAETTWFHVFKDMIDNGDVAKMGAHAVTAYLVIKSHTNFSTGRNFPSLETIATKSGMSERQVLRELKTLEEHGYVIKSKSGRRNNYTLREKVTIKDESGRPQAVATWDYIPSSVRDAVADLKRVMVTGDLGGARIVNIENLTLNIVSMGDHSTNINVSDSSIAKLPKEMQDMLRAIRENANAK
jgi:biotin operon repressor